MVQNIAFTQKIMKFNPIPISCIKLVLLSSYISKKNFLECVLYIYIFFFKKKKNFIINKCITFFFKKKKIDDDVVKRRKKYFLKEYKMCCFLYKWNSSSLSQNVDICQKFWVFLWWHYYYYCFLFFFSLKEGK